MPLKFVNFILLVMLVLLQHRLWTGNGSLPDVHRLERVRAEQVQENARLRDRNTALTAEVADLKTGLDAVEERARSEMGMIRSGETYVQIIDSPTSKNTRDH